jgi:hypothetical protein
MAFSLMGRWCVRAGIDSSTAGSRYPKTEVDDNAKTEIDPEAQQRDKPKNGWIALKVSVTWGYEFTKGYADANWHLYRFYQFILEIQYNWI